MSDERPPNHDPHFHLVRLARGTPRVRGGGMIRPLQFPGTTRRTAGTVRDVFCAFAMHVDDDYECYPSLARVAEFLGLDRDTVRRAVRTLEDARVMVPFGSKRGGRGETTIYWIDAEIVEELRHQTDEAHAVGSPKGAAIPRVESVRSDADTRGNSAGTPAETTRDPRGNYGTPPRGLRRENNQESNHENNHRTQATSSLASEDDFDNVTQLADVLNRQGLAACRDALGGETA